jgi:large conductance mechanosensitive channel
MNIKGFITEFKEFALKGNLIELAIAFVMGAAFSRLSTAFIEGLVMPWIALIGDGADTGNLYLPLRTGIPAGLPLEEARALGPVLAWGDFVSVASNFLILAMVMFLVMKTLNRAKRAKATDTPPAAPEPTREEQLLEEIRDLLKSRG